MKKIFGILLCLALIAGDCFAQDISLAQQITYRKIKLTSQIGSESIVLVNRWTGKVEYVWNGSLWMPAPPIFQYYYDNRKKITKRLKEAQQRQLLRRDTLRQTR